MSDLRHQRLVITFINDGVGGRGSCGDGGCGGSCGGGCGGGCDGGGGSDYSCGGSYGVVVMDWLELGRYQLCNHTSPGGGLGGFRNDGGGADGGGGGW